MSSSSASAVHSSAPGEVAAACVAATATQPASIHWRLTQIATGHVLYGTLNYFFDYVLYPFVVYTQGMLIGGGLMTMFSLTVCALLLMIYERMGIDWVGGGLLADITRKPNPTWSDRVVVWVARRNATLTFFVLCAVTDPFIITAFFRRGTFDGLRSRDWQIFFASVLVGNLYWIFVADLIGHAFAMFWQWLVSMIG